MFIVTTSLVDCSIALHLVVLIDRICSVHRVVQGLRRLTACYFCRTRVWMKADAETRDLRGYILQYAIFKNSNQR